MNQNCHTAYVTHQWIGKWMNELELSWKRNFSILKATRKRMILKQFFFFFFENWMPNLNKHARTKFLITFNFCHRQLSVGNGATIAWNNTWKQALFHAIGTNNFWNFYNNLKIINLIADDFRSRIHVFKIKKLLTMIILLALKNCRWPYETKLV